MSKRTIKTYSDDFKRDALKYIESHPDLSIASVADSLGVPKETLYGWTKAATRQKLFPDAVSTYGPMSEAEKELVRLKRENQNLKDALEVLKKAISILND